MSEFYDMLSDWRIDAHIDGMCQDDGFAGPKAESSAHMCTTGPEALAAQKTNLLGALGSNDQEYVGYPRASSIYTACMRYHLIGYKNHVAVPKRNLSVNMLLAFALGNSMHKLVQNTNVFFGDEKVGWWKCVGCGHKNMFGKRPTKCSQCNARGESLVYYENYSRIEKAGKFHATTHQDLFIDETGPDSLKTVEIKTISRAKFGDLVAPLVEHEWQVILTSVMASVDQRIMKSGYRVSADMAYVLYIPKGWVTGVFPLKMYEVKRTERLWGRIKKKIGEFSECLEKGTIPQIDGKCAATKWGDWKAKLCPCKEICRQEYEK